MAPADAEADRTPFFRLTPAFGFRYYGTGQNRAGFPKFLIAGMAGDGESLCLIYLSLKVRNITVFFMMFLITYLRFFGGCPSQKHGH